MGQSTSERMIDDLASNSVYPSRLADRALSGRKVEVLLVQRTSRADRWLRDLARQKRIHRPLGLDDTAVAHLPPGVHDQRHHDSHRRTHRHDGTQRSFPRGTCVRLCSMVMT